MPMRVGLPSYSYSFLIEKRGNLIVAQDSRGRIQYSGTDASTVIQSALNALTPNRTWKEKVVVKGDYSNLGQIAIPSYTIFEVHGSLKAKNMLNTHFIYAYGQTDFEIRGGFIDANKEGQTESMSAIQIENCQRFIVEGVKVRGGFRKGAPDFTGESHGEGICAWNSSYGQIINNYSYEAIYDNIKVRGGSTYIVVANNICKDSQYKGGIQVSSEGTAHINVIGNVIYQNYHSLDNGIRIHAADDVLVDGNVIYCYNSAAIQLIDAAQFNTISNNKIYTNSIGIQTFGNTPSSARPSYNCFKGNTIHLATNAANTGIAIANGDYNEIKDNIIYGYSSSTGINIGSSYSTSNKIGVNTFYGVGTRIVNNGTTTQMINPDIKQGGTINTLSTSATEYLPPSGQGSPNTDETSRRQIVAEDCFISGFRVQLSAAPGTGATRTFTIRKNGADTALSVTFGATDTVKENLQNWVYFAKGDVITISSTLTGTPAAAYAQYCYRLLTVGGGS
jgi:hypothetical protein